ncbi:MAG TPA: peptidase [Phycisphaerales bacterium]|nr:peptidase [Phycisphaerales bacterium]HCD34097.1 peptidase [Phycisphaerales bacterium]|tara:strand:+ start:21845 stop:22954 length:1110 start_codon:yes stop_codon:yes gene_type:complete
MPSLIFDAHLDLAWNALQYDRDQRLDVLTLRNSESHMITDTRGKCTVSLPAMRQGGVAICCATLLARVLPDGFDQPQHPSHRSPKVAYAREDIDFADSTIAYGTAYGQLGYYRLLESLGEIQLIYTAWQLKNHIDSWQPTSPIGVIMAMEGTDPIVEPAQVKHWFDLGMRVACLAHYGQSAHAMGTGFNGPLTAVGIELVKQMDEQGVILDLVHTADLAINQALDLYSKPVCVSHANVRTLVEGDRQLSDSQIQKIAQRKGVIGIALCNFMLKAGYSQNKLTREEVSLTHVAHHIDHICQLVGNADCVGIGSDMDGGFGVDHIPKELQTISDLPKLADALHVRGFADVDINKILIGNWTRFFAENLPAD